MLRVQVQAAKHSKVHNRRRMRALCFQQAPNM